MCLPCQSDSFTCPLAQSTCQLGQEGVLTDSSQSPKPPSLLHLTRAAAGGRTGFSPRNARRPAAGTAAPACHRPRQSPPWSHPVPSSHSCREMRAPKMNVRPMLMSYIQHRQALACIACLLDTSDPQSDEGLLKPLLWREENRSTNECHMLHVIYSARLHRIPT